MVSSVSDIGYCRFETIASASQGFLSFWRGNGAAMLRFFPQQAINFSTKDKLRALFEPKRGGAGQPPPSFARRLAGNLAAGGTAGGLCLALLYPLDFARAYTCAAVLRYSLLIFVIVVVVRARERASER